MCDKVFTSGSLLFAFTPVQISIYIVCVIISGELMKIQFFNS